MALRLKELREAAGLTQEQVAMRLGKVHSSVQRWESGERNPGVDDLEQLAALFKCHPGELFDPPAAPPLSPLQQKAVEIVQDMTAADVEAWLRVGASMGGRDRAA